MPSLNVKNWRDLAQGTEYVPPHLSLVEVQTPKPKAVTSSNLSHLREAHAIQSQKKGKGKTKTMHAHRIFMEEYPRPNRSCKTLDAIVHEIEMSQKKEIRTRLSGHLNEKHVFAALPSLPPTSSPTMNKAISFSLHDVKVSIPDSTIVRSKNAEKEVNTCEKNVADNLTKSNSFSEFNSPPSRVRSATFPEFSLKTEPILREFSNNTKNADKIMRLRHQMKEELKLDRHPLAQLAIASQYFDSLIQDFRIYASLFSEIKAVYDSVTDFYKTEVMELEVLKRRLINEIINYQKKVKAENIIQDRADNLEMENASLKDQVANLQAMLEHYQRVSRPNSVDVKTFASNSRLIRSQKEMSDDDRFSDGSQD